MENWCYTGTIKMKLVAMKNLIILSWVSLFLTIPFTLVFGQFQNGDPYIDLSRYNSIVNEDALSLIRQANLAWQSGDVDRALRLFDDAAGVDPESAFVRVQRAKVYRRMGLDLEASSEIDRATQINPYATFVYDYYGPKSVLPFLAFQPIAASQPISPQQRYFYYKQLSQKEEEARYDLIDEEASFIVQTVQDVEQLKVDRAMVRTDSFLARYPASAIGWDIKGMIYLHKQDYDAAKGALEMALTLEPSFAIAWYNLARVEKAKGNLKLAESHLDQAVQLEQTLTKALFERALIRKELGDELGALSDYNSLLTLAEDRYLQAYLNRGVTRKMMGDLEGALADINQAIQEEPFQALQYMNRANVYFLFGKYHAALADYSKALELDDTMAKAFYNRALVKMKLTDMEGACLDFEVSENLGYQSDEDLPSYFCP